jgi:hypothetical protein
LSVQAFCRSDFAYFFGRVWSNGNHCTNTEIWEGSVPTLRLAECDSPARGGSETLRFTPGASSLNARGEDDAPRE